MKKSRIEQIIKEETESILKEMDAGQIIGLVGLTSMIGIPVMDLAGQIGRNYLKQRRVKKDALAKLQADAGNVEKIKELTTKIQNDKAFKALFGAWKNATPEYKQQYLERLKTQMTKVLSAEEQRYVENLMTYVTT